MNIDDLLGTLLPLFEKKMAFNMEMSERALTLEEQKEKNKTDLEYKKLEDQLKTDKDKLAWEKEKAIAGFKNGIDLQTLHNQGLVDVARINNDTEMEKAKLDSEAKKYGFDLGYLQSMDTQKVEMDKDDPTKVASRTGGTSAGINTANAIRSRMGLVPQQDTTTTTGMPLDEKVTAVRGILTNIQNNSGTPEEKAIAARNFMGTVDQETRNAMSQEAAIEPQPVTARPALTRSAPIISPVSQQQPAHPPVIAAAPTRSAIQPTGFFQNAGAITHSFMHPSVEPDPLMQGVNAGPQSGIRTALDQGVATAARGTVNTIQAIPGAVAGAGRNFMTGYDAEAERKRQEDTRKKARGLTSGIYSGF